MNIWRASRWVLFLLISGCSAGKMFQKGRVAEDRSRPEVAYEQYCAAAAESRGNGDVAEGLRRVRPAAAAHWESQALVKMDEGQFDQAWRMLMKALEIEPDHPNAPKLIRKLSEEHPAEIAAARADWVRTGSLGVLLPRAVVREATETRVATAKRSSKGARKGSVKRVKQRPRGRDERVASFERAAKAASDEPLELEANTLVEADPGRDGTTAVTRQPWAVPRSATTTDDDHTDGPAETIAKTHSRTSGSMSAGEFLIIVTLSDRERLHPRTGRGVDGIDLKLRDASDDEEVDVDLLAGGKRIKKIRDLKLGSSQVFSGTSGRLYRITLLSIQPKSRTARLGIKAA